MRTGPGTVRDRLLSIYGTLERSYPLGETWPRGDWPLDHGFRPPRLEMVVGAVLTQNVSWANVKKGLAGLVREGLINPREIALAPRARLEEAIRPTGFFRRKAALLQRMARLLLEREDFFRQVSREDLLALPGVGPETADSILLYACGRPRFVVDAYTLRLLARYGLAGEDAGYRQVQLLFEEHLPRRPSLYKRFHALIVEHGQRTCRKTPLCGECALREECRAAGEAGSSREPKGQDGSPSD